jgi:mannose-6-phosphate isomerase-like protein (cupin superfamily)
MQNFVVAQIDQVPAVPCPCGSAKRAFASVPDSVASVHQVDIRADAQRHYHKKMTEIYVVLEGEGHLELDGQMIAVKPMTSVMIKPGCRHRAIGRLKILNIAVPAFDAGDEWFD